MTTIATNRLYCLVVTVGLVFSACHREKINPIAPDQFTKPQLESLGQILQHSIADNQEDFTLLPNSAPYDTTIYWFIQTLYDQATNVMRVDHQSPEDNRWSVDRKWRVHILMDEIRNAFILPGGDLYITTGLLSILKEEYELYYIISFEANLMNKGLLLETLVSEVNSIRLEEMIRRNFEPDNAEIIQLSHILSTLRINPADIQANDQTTINSICNTSQWNKNGLIPLLENFDTSIEWFHYRSSYSNRIEWLLNVEPEQTADCGNLKTNNPSGEGYKRYVLDWLN
jgi:hypothetical protein